MNTLALKIAIKVVKMFEGCVLVSYPDVASPLYTALTNNGMAQKYMRGEIKWKDLPKNFQALSGAPWSAMYGETKGIKPDMTFTQKQADELLAARVQEFMEGALKITPELEKMSPSQIAAITSFCYNVGLTAYKNSTVAKKIVANDTHAAADAMLMWTKAQGKILNGLVRRREVERNLFLSA